MNAHHMAHRAEQENQAFALMARLHVSMRRAIGRITDVEYMRIDPVYCRHLIELALQSDLPDLQKIGERLNDIYFGEEGLFVQAPPKPPLLARLSEAAAGTAAVHASVPPVSPEEPQDPDHHYVGRLR